MISEECLPATMAELPKRKPLTRRSASRAGHELGVGGDR